MKDNGIFNGNFEILKVTFYIGNVYRDAMSFSQGNFPSSQHPETTSSQPIKTPQSSVPQSPQRPELSL